MEPTSQRILLGAAGAGGKKQFVVYAVSSSPYLKAYPWIKGVGYGVAYSDPTSSAIPNPKEVKVNPATGTTIATSGQSSNYLSLHSFSASTGFGGGASYPSGLSAGVGCVAFHPNGNDVAAGLWQSPWIRAWPVTTSFGTPYSDPSVLPSGNNTQGVDFHPSGNYIATASDAKLNAWAFTSGVGFGAKVADPVGGPTISQSPRDITFSPNGSAVVFALNSSPYIGAQGWTGSGFGTRYSDPSTLPVGSGYRIAFSPNGAAVAVAHMFNPGLTVYVWNGTSFGAKYANPSTPIGTTATDVCFSADGDVIFSNDYAYEWLPGFGTRYSQPSGFPGALCVAFGEA